MEATLRDGLIKSAFQYQDALQAYAFGVLRDWSLAEDVVQDAFIVVMNQCADFEPGTSLFGWVRQIVHNKAMEARRARTRQMLVSEEALLARIGAALDQYFDERSADLLRQKREALEECMSRLGARSISLLSGFYARAQSCETLAQRQGRTANAVRITLHRLRKQLQDCVSRRIPAPEAGR
jgi:RNA polymerase sigma-70 factor (ECF subfamily)